MTKTRSSNPETALDAVASSLHKCWSHFHVLKGLHEAVKEFPEVIPEYEVIPLQIWKGAFEALFVGTGTLLDKRRDTVSLKTAFECVQQFGTSTAKQMAGTFLVELNSKSKPFAAFKLWRDNAVAHSSDIGRQLNSTNRTELQSKTPSLYLKNWNQW